VAKGYSMESIELPSALIRMNQETLYMKVPKTSPANAMILEL